MPHRSSDGARRIAPAVDTNVIAQVIALIGDGLFWRRAVDPDFDAKAVLPVLIEFWKSYRKA